MYVNPQRMGLEVFLHDGVNSDTKLQKSIDHKGINAYKGSRNSDQRSIYIFQRFVFDSKLHPSTGDNSFAVEIFLKRLYSHPIILNLKPKT